MANTEEIIRMHVEGLQDVVALSQAIRALGYAENELLKSSVRLNHENEVIGRTFKFATDDGARLAVTMGRLEDGTLGVISATSDLTHRVVANGRALRKATTDQAKYDVALAKNTAAVNHMRNAMVGSFTTMNQMNNHFERSQSVLLSWQSVVRLVIVQLLHRAFAEVAQRIGDATTSVTDFLVSIGEIQTLSQQNQLAVGKWADGLVRLSNEFGSDLLDTTKGAYEALSNQIVEGAETFNFIREELKLSTIAVASVAETIDSTTAILNAFNMSTTESARINAILWKTVDLGRTTLSEMSGDLGRISVLAAQLNITLEEQSAALATLTIQGLKHNIAQTFLYNVYLKLIKPTKTMTEIFDKWGVTSGQAAIETYGFFGVLRKLAEEAENNGDVMEEMGEQWGRIRALTGAVGLSKNFEGLEKNLNAMKNASEEAQNAFEIMMNNPGKQLQIQLQQIRNYFTETFGINLIKILINFTHHYGSLLDVSKAFISVLKSGIISFGLWRFFFMEGASSVKLLNVAWQHFVGIQTLVQLGMTRTQAIAISLRAVMTTMWPVITAAGVFASVMLYEHWANAAERIDSAAEQIQTSLQKVADEDFFEQTLSIDKYAQRFEEILKDNFEVFNQYAAAITRENLQFTNELTRDLEQVSKTLKRETKEALDIVGDSIKKLQKNMEDGEKAIEKFQQMLEGISQSAEERAFRSSLIGLDFDKQIDALQRRLGQFHNEAANAIAKGDSDAAEKALREADKLDKEITNKLAANLKKQEGIREQADKKINDLQERKAEQELQIKEKLENKLQSIRERIQQLFVGERNVKNILQIRKEIQEYQEILRAAGQEEKLNIFKDKADAVKQLRDAYKTLNRVIRDLRINEDALRKGVFPDAAIEIKAEVQQQKELIKTRQTLIDQAKAFLKNPAQFNAMVAAQQQPEDPNKAERDILKINEEINDELIKFGNAGREIVSIEETLNKFAEDRLLLEKQITDQVKDRIRIEQELSTRQSKKLASRQKNEEKLKALLQSTQDFKLEDETKRKELNRYLLDTQKAIDAIRQAPIPLNEQVQLIATLTKKRDNIVNQSINKEQQKKIQAARKEFNDAKQRLDTLAKKEIEISKKISQTATTPPEDFRKNIELLGHALDNVFILGKGGYGKEVNDAAKNIQTSLSLFAKTPSVQRFEAFTKAVENYYTVLGKYKKFTKLDAWNEVILRGETIPGAGNALTTGTIFVDIQKYINEIKKLFQEEAKTQGQIGDINKIKEGLEDLTKNIPDVYKEIIEGEKAAKNTVVSAEKIVQDSLTETLKLLNAINAAQRQRILDVGLDANVPIGGRPKFRGTGFAFGGRGVDVMPAMLSPNELVLTGKQTRSFVPLIKGLSTPHYARGGEVTNVGDINITVQGGNTSDVTIREIARGLNRELRRGTVKWRS
jgi:TP901 family phage tail tape measure protein